MHASPESSWQGSQLCQNVMHCSVVQGQHGINLNLWGGPSFASLRRQVAIELMGCCEGKRLRQKATLGPIIMNARKMGNECQLSWDRW